MDFRSINPESFPRVEMNESLWFCNQWTCKILRAILEKFWFKDYGSRKDASVSYIVYVLLVWINGKFGATF